MSERYARLKQFEFADFSRLSGKRAIIVGVGGLGALTAEILARVGMGELVLMDYDELEEANLNRLIYSIDQVGMPKVDALREHLLKANPDVRITTYPYDITDGKGFDAFLQEMERCDIVFGCVDTFQVRLFINSRAVKSRKPFIDGGASNDGIDGSVHIVIPGETACYRCNRPLVREEREYKHREDGSGMCHFASLPTTMAIISSLQCQEGLKHLLGFGKVASYLMYYGLEGKLERYDWKRDPDCPVCGKV
ncbi:MAG: ThiF family adenylyltransferase [Thermoplasmata archaeon]